MVKIDTMVEFFKDYDFKSNTLILDHCTKITDLKKFTDNHIGFLINNPKNRTFKPYYDRLLNVYLKLKK